MKTISRFSIKTVNALSIFASALILALLCGSSAFAGTLLVDDDTTECPEAGFNTIQEAVDAAASGDIIQVCPGTYDEQVEIAKPLSLVGVKRDGKNAAVVQPSNMQVNTRLFNDPLASAIVVRDTSGVTIQNIIVDGINNGIVCDPTPPFIDGISWQNASGELAFVTVRNMLTPDGCAFGDAVDIISSGGGASQLTLRDSSIHDYDSFGVFALGSMTNLQALRNVITGPTPTVGRDPVGIFLASGVEGLIEGNTVTNNTDATCLSLEECNTVGIGIIVFDTHDVSIHQNVVTKSQRGISASFTDGVTILQNTVSDTDVVDAINIFASENTLVKDNSITNTDRAAIIVFTGNNTIQGNAINEAAIGLLVSEGNSVAGNRLSNTQITRQLFVPGGPAAIGQGAVGPDAFSPSDLRKGLPR